MCGFAGFLDLSPNRVRETNDLITVAMTDAIRHRGPDDAGLWGDIEEGIQLGFRRLSIIDLSPNGHQPMHSSCGRYTIVFNGEIYNFKYLKKEIEATQKFTFPFRGHSDTEVLLAGFTVWGVEATLPKTNGMFAFAVWDRETRTLCLGRDRIGEKPLYYGWSGDSFLFASELRCFSKNPKFTAEIDRDNLALYFRYNQIPAPYSVFKGISKLLPGTSLRIGSEIKSSNPVPYWSAKDVIAKAKVNPFTGSFDEALKELETLLKESVLMRMESDVPLGAFLSGGVDSSTIVALMQSQTNQPVRTFTIGFKEDAYDEAKFAKEVARHLGTNHTELYLTVEDALKTVPHLGEFYDEPFADSSQIPTLLVSRLARQSVTVALSGDAGDELFAGYNRYQWANTIWNSINRLPTPARRQLSSALQSVSPENWNRVYKRVASALPKRLQASNPGDKIHKLAKVLHNSTRADLYQSLVSHWNPPTHLVLGAQEPPLNNAKPESILALPELTEMMMAMDLLNYLPNDILVKVDRASMHESLESRIPLLDHRLVEFAWRLPMSFKIKDKQSKYILREILYRHVPRKLIERPKMGFGVPIESWLRTNLRDWAETLLNPEKLKSQGFLSPELVNQTWQAHLSGFNNFQHKLWGVLMFQTWLEGQTKFPASLSAVPSALRVNQNPQHGTVVCSLS